MAEKTYIMTTKRGAAMGDLLLPSRLLGKVMPEALERIAEAAGFRKWPEQRRYATAWSAPGATEVGLVTPTTTEIADYRQVVQYAIEDLARVTGTDPLDVLRDAIGTPVSIPAQGWRVPRQCDYGRKDGVVEAHCFPAVTRWVVYLPGYAGVGRTSEGGKIMIHDIAELPTS